MDKDLAEVYANTYIYKCSICERSELSRDEVHRCENGEDICDRCDKIEVNYGVITIPDLKKEA